METAQITFSYLKRLNKEIKSGDVSRQNKAFKILKAIELKGLNPGLIMYIDYLQGKHHYLNFKRDDSLASIEEAVECYRKVFQTARWYRVNVRNPK